MKYYVAEIQNANSYRKAEEIQAKDLSAAKQAASRMQAFCDTVLDVGTEVNEQGVIVRPITRKIAGKWCDLRP